MRKIKNKTSAFFIALSLFLCLSMIIYNTRLGDFVKNIFHAAVLETVDTTNGTATYINGNYTYTFIYNIENTEKNSSNEQNTCKITNITIAEGNTSSVIPLNGDLQVIYNSKTYTLRPTEYGDNENCVITNNSTKLLTNLRLSQWTKRINDYAFSEMNDLQTISAYYSSADNDFSYLESVGDYSFYKCSSLIKFGKTNNVINLPTTCNNIGENSFYEAGYNLNIGSGIKTININSIVDGTQIKENAFYNVTSASTVTIGTGVSEICENSFNGCPINSKLNWNAINCDSYNNAFVGKSIPIVNIGSSVESIPENFMKNNKYLTYVNTSETITIPASVKTIGDYAFYGCSNSSIKAISTGNGVESIGEYSFYNVSSPTVTIGTSVKNIEEKAFSKCPVTTKLVWNAIDCENYNEAFTGKSIPTIEIGSSVQRIPDNFLASETINASNLQKVGTDAKSIIIPASVKYIGKYAFKGATVPTTITINNDKEGVINESAFENCSYVTTITIGTGIEHIHENAFKNVPLTLRLNWKSVSYTLKTQ